MLQIKNTLGGGGGATKLDNILSIKASENLKAGDPVELTVSATKLADHVAAPWDTEIQYSTQNNFTLSDGKVLSIWTANNNYKASLLDIDSNGVITVLKTLAIENDISGKFSLLNDTVMFVAGSSFGRITVDVTTNDLTYNTYPLMPVPTEGKSISSVSLHQLNSNRVLVLFSQYNSRNNYNGYVYIYDISTSSYVKGITLSTGTHDFNPYSITKIGNNMFNSGYYNGSTDYFCCFTLNSTFSSISNKYITGYNVSSGSLDPDVEYVYSSNSSSGAQHLVYYMKLLNTGELIISGHSLPYDLYSRFASIPDNGGYTSITSVYKIANNFYLELGRTGNTYYSGHMGIAYVRDHVADRLKGAQVIGFNTGSGLYYATWFGMFFKRNGCYYAVNIAKPDGSSTKYYYVQRFQFNAIKSKSIIHGIAVNNIASGGDGQMYTL